MKLFFTHLSKSKKVMFAAALLLVSGYVSAQLPYEHARQTYRSGQHTEVAYEGWRENEDGDTVFTFGYFNHNWEEELDIPIGENNFFSPGEVDRGQPTHFLPRRNRFTFDVVVPEGFGQDDELVWEVTSPNESLAVLTARCVQITSWTMLSLCLKPARWVQVLQTKKPETTYLPRSS